MKYNVELIETKSSKEYWIHSRAIWHGYKNNNAGKPKKRTEELTGEALFESIKRKVRYYKNMRWEVSRLVNMNIDDATKFFTLTNHENITDVDQANYEFNKFIKRLKYYLNNNFGEVQLKYIATWEKQKRGSIHYHVILFGFPYIRKKVLADMWGFGIIKINKVDHKEGSQVGLYVSKYFGKELDLRDYKKKAFFMSKNLKKPLKEKIDIPISKDIKVLIETINDDNVVYQNEYETRKYINGEWYKDTINYFVVDKIKKVEHNQKTQGALSYAQPLDKDIIA